MSSITILGKKYNILIIVASVVLSVFILSLTVSDCTSCDKCNKKVIKSLFAEEKVVRSVVRCLYPPVILLESMMALSVN